jgi:hypothetical protein
MSHGLASPVIRTLRVNTGVSVDEGGTGAGGGGGGDPDGGGVGEPVGAGASAEELPPPHAKSALVAPKESAKKMAARFMMNSLSTVIQPFRLIAAKL